MNEPQKPDYGNWVTLKTVLGFFFSALSIFIIALLVWFYLALAELYLSLAIIGLSLLFSSFYLAYVRHAISPNVYNLAKEYHQLVMTALGHDQAGRLLDIGCGNGGLAIELAAINQDLLSIGLDTWGRPPYQVSTCSRNALLRNVSDRVIFLSASAARLPFADESFEAVCSNFVFHQIEEFTDKRLALYEALRVLKKGGHFAFHDMFYVTQMYGQIEEFQKNLRSAGYQKVCLQDTCHAAFLPRLLRPPFSSAKSALLYGIK